MALLDGKTHKEYYEGNNLGSYQFVSLQDVGYICWWRKNNK